jgi:hypothetical protein
VGGTNASSGADREESILLAFGVLSLSFSGIGGGAELDAVNCGSGGRSPREAEAIISIAAVFSRSASVSTSVSASRVTSVFVRFMLSSSAFFSAFLLSIHHTAPLASQASLRTEWTICPMSKPIMLRLLSNLRSSGVEKSNGAGVDSKDA